MEAVRLQDVEESAETESAVAALRRGETIEGWVQPYSANGKHGITARRDPQDPAER